MPEENVTSFAVAAFRARLEKLVAAQQISNADFADAVYTAVSAHGLPEQRLRETFGGTSGMVERWMMAENLPQPSARTGVIKWIIENI